MCLVGFLAFAAKLIFDTALRASGDYLAYELVRRGFFKFSGEL